MFLSWQSIAASLLAIFSHAGLFLAQPTKEPGVTGTYDSLSSVDKFITYAPGKYEHFDLLYLLDYEGLDKSSPSSDACPNIMILRNFSKVDNNTADLEFTELIFDNVLCSATPMTEENALRFIRIHLDMFFNPQQKPSNESDPGETPDQFDPFNESIDHLRGLIDNNMFQWYAQIHRNVINCLPGNESVEEGSMFAVNAYKFFSLLLDSINSLTGSQQQPSPEMSPQTRQDSIPIDSRSLKQNDVHAAMPASRTVMSDNVLKNISGHYFFSYVSSNSSCLYVQQRDVQMLRDVMRFEEQKAAEDEEQKGFYLKPGTTIVATAVCNCGDDFPRVVEIRALNQTTLPNVKMHPFPGRFLQRVEAMLLSPYMWSDTSVHQAEEEDDGEIIYKFDVKFDGMECAISRVLDLSDIVQQVERPSFGSTLSQNGTSKPTVREFVEAAVILKYFQEITGKQGQEILDSIPIETMLEMSSQLMLAADKVSKVLVLDAGSKCGPRVIEHDIVVLVEHRHIFKQLRHLPIYQLLNSNLTDRLLGFDDDNRRFTVHVLQDKDEGITSCSYASSEGAVALLSTQCQFFRTLGSGGFRYRKDNASTSDVPEPSHHVTNGGNDKGEEDKQSGTESPGSEDADEGDKAKFQPTSEELEESSSMPELENSPEYATTAATPRASPSSGGNSNNSGRGGGGMCFPAEALATLEDGTMVPMTALKVGDMVADGTGGTSKILVFAHQDFLTRSEFVRIVTGQGDIVLSPSHYIYTNHGLMTAESVQVGDQIETIVESRTGLAQVTHLFRETKVGLFNPITISGSIAVAGGRNDADQVSSKKTAFKASCFTSIVDVATSATLVAPLRWLERFLGISLPAVSDMFKNGNQFWPLFLKQGANVSQNIGTA